LVEGSDTTKAEDNGIPMQYKKYAKLFENPEDLRALPKHQPWDHEINLKEGREPPCQKLRPHSQETTRTLEEYIQAASKKGWIRPSKSPAASNMFIVHKADDPKGRPVVDYRELNDATIKDKYPLPALRSLRDMLGKAKIFTKLDQRTSFALIRIKEGHEWKTAFMLPSGLWEYTVMPFGLSNAPATCQRQNENILRENLGKFVICYLDDILVFSDNESEHQEHVEWVLQQFAKVNSILKLSKCEFGVKKTKYLGYIIRPGEISIDPEKLRAIKEWESPQNVKDIQSFQGFTNFCRMFIKNFSDIMTPLTALTRKGVPFEWTKEHEDAFQQIKIEFCKEPIIKQYQPDREALLETDASDVAVGAVLLQLADDGKLHPVEYYSRTMSPAEQNYNIYEKELMAIVDALKHWKNYLQGAQFPTTVHTDHQNLQTFTTTKVLDNRRLARWAEELAAYDIRIKHVPGTKNPRADALSRKPGYEANKVYDTQPLLRKLENGDLAPGIRQVAVMTISNTTLVQRIKDSYVPGEEAKPELRPYTLTCNKEGLLVHEGRIYIPSKIRNDFIREQHELPAHGHQGITRTYRRIARDYWCPKLKEEVKKVVDNCDSCIRNKPSHHAPYGNMGTVPIPDVPWKSVSWDFITDLPTSGEPMTGARYDSILVIMERLTKYMILVPYLKSSTAEQLAYAFLRDVISKHGLPEEILSDRDRLFTSKFWIALTALLGTKRKLSTAFHPQTNGGNERMNQVVEAYLRCYINYQQTNWVELLPLAQFAYNSSTTETTKTTPFYANFGYELVAYREPGIPDADNQLARIQVSRIKELHSQLASDLQFVAERNAHYYNKKHSQEPTLKEGDKVYLVRKNIKTKRPSDKLDYKKLGPYTIKKVRGRVNYELTLPKNMKIHPVFHISLLELAPPGAPRAPYIEIDPINPNAEYEVEEILDCKFVREKIKYLIKWEGYPHSENTWEPKKNVSAPLLLAKFHRQNPDLPRKDRKDQNQTMMQLGQGRAQGRKGRSVRRS